MILLDQKTGVVASLSGLAQSIYAAARGLGGPGLLVIALADSSFISVPEGNDLLIVILSTGQGWDRMIYYVSMTVLGSVAGCSILYWVGRRGGKFIEKRVTGARLERARRSYQKWGVWAVVVPSILPPPTPFKVFVLSAGVFKLSFLKFFLAIGLGRTFRYLMWGVLAVLYGELARDFMEQHLPMVGLILLLILVGATVLYMVFRSRRKLSSDSTA